MDGIKLVNVSKFYTVDKESIKVIDKIDLNTGSKLKALDVIY